MTALFATFSLMSFLTAPLWGRLSDRVGRRPVLTASMAAPRWPISGWRSRRS